MGIRGNWHHLRPYERLAVLLGASCRSFSFIFTVCWAISMRQVGNGRLEMWRMGPRPHSPGTSLLSFNALCRQKWDNACFNRGTIVKLKNALQKLWQRMWGCQEGRRGREGEGMAVATVSSSGPGRHLVWKEEAESNRWLAPSPPLLPDTIQAHL